MRNVHNDVERWKLLRLELKIQRCQSSYKFSRGSRRTLSLHTLCRLLVNLIPCRVCLLVLKAGIRMAFTSLAHNIIRLNNGGYGTSSSSLAPPLSNDTCPSPSQAAHGARSLQRNTHTTSPYGSHPPEMGGSPIMAAGQPLHSHSLSCSH